MIRPPPIATRTDHPFPYTTLFRSAEIAPAEFLSGLWPLCVAVFLEIVSRLKEEGVEHVYSGQYVLEITLTPSETRSSSRPGPLMNALQIAIEGLASSTPEAFLKWAEENSQLDALVVQQLVAHGYRIAADQLSSLALDWLLLDPRRFQRSDERRVGKECVST